MTLTPAAAPQLAQLTLASANVVGGTATSGTVTLTAPAGANGITVRLASSKTTVATVPASVKVPAVARRTTFAIWTTHASRNRSATITATYGSVKKSPTLNVTR